ncbi:prenyltransferase/squalene oxidase repeat-containing protein [Bremerella sp. JC770]|uniref:prenyltransferase/squalene oxidase repeat-containing protein n=1 Tax=Bremerella sp. JC770 TaxID=3232137 RepID=UPI0034579D38
MQRRKWLSTLFGAGLGLGIGTFARLDASSTLSAEENPLQREPNTQKAIHKGMAWLVSAIQRDGTVGTDRAYGPDLSCSALTGLMFLSEGSTPYGGPYAKYTRSVLNGVLDQIERRPLLNEKVERVTLVQRKIGMNADIFFATLFLSEVYYEATEEREVIRQAIARMVDHIGRTQQSDGTWGSESWAPILGTVLGWESLRSASSAGFAINASADKVGEALMDQLRERPKEEDGWMHRFYKEASCLRVLFSMKYRDDPLFLASAEKLLKLITTDQRAFRYAGGEEYLSFYLVTQCMLAELRPSWKKWAPKVRRELIRNQNADGSWTGHHCITDRTFCTAAAVLTLLCTNHQLSISDL